MTAPQLPRLRTLFARVWVRNKTSEVLLARSGGLTAHVEPGGLGLLPSSQGDSLELAGERHEWSAPFGLYVNSSGVVSTLDAGAGMALKLGVMVTRASGAFVKRTVMVDVVPFYMLANKLEVDLEVSGDDGATSFLLKAGSEQAFHPPPPASGGEAAKCRMRVRPLSADAALSWSGVFDADMIGDVLLVCRPRVGWTPASCDNTLWLLCEPAGPARCDVLIALGVSLDVPGVRVTFEPREASLAQLFMVSNQTRRARVTAVEAQEASALPARVFCAPGQERELVFYEPASRAVELSVWTDRGARGPAVRVAGDVGEISAFATAGQFKWRVGVEGKTKTLEVTDVASS